MEIKNNDHARELIDAAGITCDNVTLKQLMELHDSLSKRLENCKNFRGTFEMEPLSLDEDRKFMTCKSDYFGEREAISFNRDGFIGMAGWASSNNITPILDGVGDWLERLSV